MEYNQQLYDVLYKFNSLETYRDSVHYWDSFIATIMIVKFLQSLSTKLSILVYKISYIVGPCDLSMSYVVNYKVMQRDFLRYDTMQES